MSNSLRLIQVCDHIIEKRHQNFVVDEPREKTGQIVELSTDKIADISSVRHGSTTLIEDVDYELYESNKIRFLNTFIPIGFFFNISYDQDIPIYVAQDPEDCELCQGNGWYADIASGFGSDKKIDFITGEEKLVQDYIKILLTDSSIHPNGTRFLSALRGNATIASSIIELAIAEANDIILANQSALMIKGVDMDPDEKFYDCKMDSIDLMSSKDGYCVTLSLYSESGANYSLTLK